MRHKTTFSEMTPDISLAVITHFIVTHELLTHGTADGFSEESYVCCTTVLECLKYKSPREKLETEPMAYTEELHFTCTGVFIFKTRIILCKLQLGRQGGNILNNTNLFFKKK